MDEVYATFHSMENRRRPKSKRKNIFPFLSQGVCICVYLNGVCVCMCVFEKVKNSNSLEQTFYHRNHMLSMLNQLRTWNERCSGETKCFPNCHFMVYDYLCMWCVCHFQIQIQCICFCVCFILDVHEFRTKSVFSMLSS